jgi:perosamine synthetase
MLNSYPLFKVHIKSAEALSEIEEVFKSGYINEGEQVTKLTNALKEKLNVENLSLTNSCTSAITMALHLAGVGPGTEVISTPMTCVASNMPIVNLYADIVWADVNPSHGMLDPNDVAKKITDKTKAVIVVAWAGMTPQLEELYDVCNKKGVKLILDAAHAFGVSYKNLPAHTWADYTCYSFQAIKHFTTGDGGALICLDDDDHKRAKSIKWFGLDRDRAKDTNGNWKGQQWDVDIEEVGYKFNMNNVAAAIGLSQIKHIDRIIFRHQVNALEYNKHFDGFVGVQHTPKPDKYCESSSWVYTMKVNEEYSKICRDDLLKCLNDEGIKAGVVHIPNDEYTVFSKFRTNLPGTREFSKNQFSLPCGWWLRYADIEYISSRVKYHTQHV